jgi:hypothetical protein
MVDTYSSILVVDNMHEVTQPWAHWPRGVSKRGITMMEPTHLLGPTYSQNINMRVALSILAWALGAVAKLLYRPGGMAQDFTQPTQDIH